MIFDDRTEGDNEEDTLLVPWRGRENQRDIEGRTGGVFSSLLLAEFPPYRSGETDRNDPCRGKARRLRHTHWSCGRCQ